MIYTQLGGTGLTVSKIGFGNMINFKPEDEQTNIDIIKACYDAGINFFDTAENYEFGHCEAQLGRSFKALNIPRERLVVSTKLINCEFPGGINVNRSKILNRKHIIDGLNASLERLQLDYVDIVYSHIWDPNTPIEEICRGFNQVIEDGKAFYWATSNWSPDQIQLAFNYCDAHDLIRPVAEQCIYHMLARKQIEADLAPHLAKGYGTTIYSPLGGGLLTGKYNTGAVPENSRASTDFGWLSKEISRFFFFDKYISNEQTLKTLQALGELAKEIGFTQAQLALAWAVVNNDVSTAIIGARNVDQVKELLKALELVKVWDAKLEKRVEDILQNTPAQPMDYRTLESRKARRQQQIG